MSDTPSGRRFTQEEFAVVLRTAAELQERVRIPDRTDGFTLAEMEEIAAEAGIPAEYIRKAATVVDATRSGFGQRVLGGPVNLEVETTLPAIDDTALQNIVDEIQRRLGTHGEAKYVLDSLQWNNKEDFGVVHLYVARRADSTRMQLLVEREGSGFVLMVVAPIVGLAAGAIISNGLGFDQQTIYAAMAGSALASIAGARVFWKARTRIWRDKLHRLMDRLVEAAGTAER